jgi:hypothetical protein
MIIILYSIRIYIYTSTHITIKMLFKYQSLAFVYRSFYSFIPSFNYITYTSLFFYLPKYIYTLRNMPTIINITAPQTPPIITFNQYRHSK